MVKIKYVEVNTIIKLYGYGEWLILPNDIRWEQLDSWGELGEDFIKEIMINWIFKDEYFRQ